MARAVLLQAAAGPDSGVVIAIVTSVSVTPVVGDWASAGGTATASVSRTAPKTLSLIGEPPSWNVAARTLRLDPLMLADGSEKFSRV
jgi:hypothetical protein